MKIYCLICKKFVEVSEKDKPCPKCGLYMCGLEDIVKKLPSYEKEVAQELIKWLNEPPGKITEAIDKIIGAITGQVGKVVPKAVAEEITKYIILTLEFIQDFSVYTFIGDKEKLLRDLESRFGKGKLATTLAKIIPLLTGTGVLQAAEKLDYDVKSVEDLRFLNLKRTDKLAGQYMGLFSNKTLAALEGGVTGMGGWALLAVDIPVLTSINFRYIQQIGTCFGYDQDLPQEKIFTNRVFMLAFGGESGIESGKSMKSGLTAKIVATYDLRAVAYALARKWTYDQMAKKTGLRGILAWLKKNAPKQMAKHITKRKAATAIPVIGAGVGATINYAITSYTGKVGWYCYRYRKLLEDFEGLGGDEIPSIPLLPSK